MKKFILLFSILFLISCSSGDEGPAGPSGSDGADGEKSGEETSLQSYSMNGYAQDGMYPYGSLVQIIPLDEDLNQIGSGSFMTTTNSDFGSYARDFEFDGQYVHAFIWGNPYDELSDTLMDFKSLNSIVDLSDDTAKNINPATTMKAVVLKHLFNNDNSADSMPGRYDDSASEAETRILNCFNMPSIGADHFENMDIAQTDKVDAVGLAISTILINGRTVGEQLEMMQIIAGQLKTSTDCDTETKNQLRSDGAALDIITIRDNLEGRFAYLGSPSLKSPPFYNHLDSDEDGIRNDEDPDSYIELLVEPHELKWHDRLNDTCTMQFAGNWDGSSSYRYFAQPFVFTSGITASKYIGFGASADYMQIYSVNDMDTTDDADDEPLLPLPVFSGGTSIVSKIPVNYFVDSYLDASSDSYSDLPSGFQAVITGHSIPVGTRVFVVLLKDANYLPTGLCYGGTGQETPFARNQQSADGVTWEGKDINGLLFTHKLLKSFGAD